MGIKKWITVIFIIIVRFSFAQNTISDKINGVSHVSLKTKGNITGIDAVKRINANWIAICPFAFLYENSGKIEYNSPINWWGDTKKGIIEEVKKARANHLKIFVKPHCWVMHKGWAGNFDLNGKTQIEWQQNYTTYYLYLAKLCDSLDVEILSIGTELKTYSNNHPDFFIDLISKLRPKYKGKLTYCANWDEYQHVLFWDKLDFISIDAYFPLLNQKTPSIALLEKKWKPIVAQLKNISNRYHKKILFSEYGYKSIDFSAYKQWEFESTPFTENCNILAQSNAYQALYNSVWNQDFMAGGFIWKWYNDDQSYSNNLNSDYTPQHKPVEQIIKKWYSIK